MKKQKSPAKLLKRLIDFVTFVNQPIRKRFILFSCGVLWWFVIMAAISITTLIVVNNTTHKIVDSIIPHEKVTQKIIRKLQSLNIDIIEIVTTKDMDVAVEKTKISKTRIEDIKTFLYNLKYGGQINDYSRDNDKFIDNITLMSIKGDIEGERYVEDLFLIIETIKQKFSEISELRMLELNENIISDEQIEVKLKEFQQLLLDSVSLSNEFLVINSQLYEVNSKKIISVLTYASFAIIAILLIETTLLMIFTIYIERAIARPVNSIIKQIQSLGEGQVDLSQKIEITSKDEIGVLSSGLNELIETIHGMATFKNIIEEDDSLADVYSRLGDVFRNIGLNEFIIYEVLDKNKMVPVYPIILSNNEIFCNEEILHNCDLCRAKRTSHIISSIDFPRMCKQFHAELDKEHICIPMIVGSSTGGVVQFVFHKSDNKNIERDKIKRKIFKAEEYIKESLHVIESKRLMNTLKDSSIKDTLTDLYNRRFLQEFVETVVPGVLRREKNIGLIMCDIDYFKQVNDSYGHDVGDMVLKETANVIKKSIRSSDLVIRFGGEEFLVLLMDIREGESMNTAGKIRENMENMKINIPDGILCKTISLGISEFPIDSKSLWQTIKFADVALYKAKGSGRNKAVKFTQDMWLDENF